MIQVSEEARALVRRLLVDAEGAGRGVRITGVDQDGDTAFEIQVADRPEANDAVLETGGIRLFLDRQAADALDDAELVVDGGDLALAVPEPAGGGG